MPTVTKVCPACGWRWMHGASIRSSACPRCSAGEASAIRAEAARKKSTRAHFRESLDICRSNRCGHWGINEQGRRGCLLHAQCPAKIDAHLMAGGACLSDPQQFGPAFVPAKHVRGLHVLTFHFNPAGFRRLAETYRQWVGSMGSLPVTCVELVVGDGEPEIPNSHVVRGDDRYLVWQKEALLNVGLRLLPPEARYVAWIDHDILIDDEDWAVKSVEVIGNRSVAIQPWGRMHYLDRTGNTVREAESASAIAKSGRYPATGPGAAWIARREDLEMIGGIYDKNIVGGGDLVWFHSLSGMRVDFLQRQSPEIRRHQEAWIRHVGGRIGWDCYPAEARHIWHGEAKNRQYVARDAILKDHGYDPERHVELDGQGVLRWSEAAPRGLREAVRKYFDDRREDGGGG